MIEGILALSVICGLATWRFASLLHTEATFEWLRRGIGIEDDEEGYPAVYPDTFLGRLFRCFWCLSLATAAPVTVLVVIVIVKGRWLWTPPVWLAASTIAIWTEKQVMRAQSR